MSEHESRLRTLNVLRTETLGPHLRRAVLGGDELAGFESVGPDDHVTVFFPTAEGTFVLPAPDSDGLQGRVPSPARDFTVRGWDLEAGELALDFVVHGDGVASNWSRRAQPGDALVVAGPHGSPVVADDFDCFVLIGDETALPAIGRWLEALPEGALAEVFIEIPEQGDRQPLVEDEGIRIHWLERNGFDAASSTLLEDALVDFEQPDGDAFYWIATEARRARNMGAFLEEHLQVPRDRVRALAYWDAHTGAM